VKHVRAAIEIDAPAGAVWPYLAEFDYWPVWGPTVSAVESDAAAVTTGARGRVKTVAGFWLPFEITAVDPGRSWHWKVAGIPATGHHVHPIGNELCRVEFTVAWPLALYVAVLRAGLTRLQQLVDGVS
jgi:uncharacterized protein YndB with AHSA1/START domain